MKNLHPFILFAVIALGIYVGSGISNESPTVENTPSPVAAEVEPTVTPNNKEEQNTQSSEVKYQVIYSIQKRYDGGISYYVLIDPVDLSKPTFIEDVKYITNKLIREKGKKISIEIFDNRDALELAYKQYGDMSLERPLTESENMWQGTHYIAGYGGELETGFYFNTFFLFPSASSDHPKVGKYVSTEEYYPE